MSGGADWQVGDLALCVDASPSRYPQFALYVRLLKQGAVYHVTHVGEAREGFSDAGATILTFAELPNNEMGNGWNTCRFRKIKPDTHEPCEEEFAELLKRKSAPVEIAQPVKVQS